MNVSFLYICILLSPLLNSILLGLTGRFLGIRGAKRLTTLFFCTGTFVAWFLLISIMSANKLFSYYINLYTWLLIGDISCKFEFVIDPLTLIMATVIMTISTVVHFFSFEYLETDPHLIRFLSLLSLFTFFMLFLVSAANVTLLFFGWEGVGILSYLLIGFWYNRIPSLKGAIKAVLFNKIGDIALLFAIGLLISYCGSSDFGLIKENLPFLMQYHINIGNINISIAALICGLVIIAAIGKSAQLSLHLWLPDAMEGPTPVSALLHAATMVTAGVFLLLRFHGLIELFPAAKIGLMILGLTTAFAAGILSAMSTDLKKSIAYSTCSQLGYMFFACGAGLFTLSLYHLFNHAFYKALLFISAGRLIAITNAQDSRYMANSGFILPLNALYQIIAGLSLAGVPAFSGFYSKELILDQIGNSNFQFDGIYTYSVIFFLLGSASAFLTSYYTGNQLLQLLSESFVQEVLYFYKSLKKKIEFTAQAILLELGLLTLVFASIFSGSIFYFIFGTLDIFEQSVYTSSSKILSEVCFADLELGFFETIPLYCSLGGFFYCWLKVKKQKWSHKLKYLRMPRITSKFAYIIKQPVTFFWVEQKLYFEFWCCEFLIYNTFLVAFYLLQIIEKGFLDYYYTIWSYTKIDKISSTFLKYTQSGDMRIYILRVLQSFLISLVILIIVAFI